MLTMLLIFWLVRSGRTILGHRPRCALSILTICAILMICIPTISLGTDRYQRGIGTMGLGDDWRKGDSPQRPDFPTSATTDDAGREQLREGTLIPPTVGQIVLLGRRWAFVPAVDQPATEVDLLAAHRHAHAAVSGPDARSRSSNFGVEPPRESRLPARDRPRGLAGDQNTSNSAADPEPPHLVVIENLMLQRIVEAIRADPSDDRWSLSGEVTEFFKENRLLIHTAQRAN